MADQTSNTINGQSNTGRHHSIVERIMEKITGKHHHHNDQQKMKHQFGGADNEHDNAYAGEAGIVGAHAIPPMTTHADPNHQRHKGKAIAQSKPANPPTHAQSAVEPFQGDRLSGGVLHSAERDPQQAM